MQLLTSILKKSRLLTAIVFAAWVVCLADWMWMQKLPGGVTTIVAALAASVAAGWCVWAYRIRTTQPVNAAAVASVAFVPLWHFAVMLADGLDMAALRVELAWWGTVTFYGIGLLWGVRGLEQASQHFERRRREALADAVSADDLLSAAMSGSRTKAGANRQRRGSHPLDPDAWYYGRKSNKLNQSLTAFSTYSALFLLVFMAITHIGGCEEIYEMPAGGGKQQTIAQTVKLQKVIKKKFVVNPFSAISFKVPPIDEVKLQLTEVTQHQYTVGYGAGTDAGFAGGTKLGKVRFIRLEYQGGDWDQEMGIGSDVNMLIEYGIRTKQKVSDKTESRPIAALKLFPAEKCPPMVYITGQKNIQLSASEVKILREYLLDKHGMLFIDNGGSPHFHNQVIAMMKNILPQVRPAAIPLDDVIHRIPYQIPFLPYVAPHGGKEALGWRVDGRLICYYHPGDIADAWADDHAGVSPEIWEACYQLGTNVIFYAHSEYSKWLTSRGPTKE